MDILVVGYGIVGHNLSEGIKAIKPEIYDKYKDVDTRTKDKYNLCIICVDTPLNDEHLCDTTEIENALDEHDADIYILKSTVLPHTTEKLIEKTGKTIIFSPEYYAVHHIGIKSYPAYLMNVHRITNQHKAFL